MGIGLRGFGWERFEFDKDVFVDEDEIEGKVDIFS